jgi:hypothetical protein
MDDKNKYYCLFLLCSPCCWNFRRSEVGVRLGSDALLLLLDLDLVVALSSLIWFGWPPCSYFLAALLLLLVSSWCSSMWPWWLICFAGIFVVLFWELFLVFLRWGEKKGVACGVCGCLWWCLSSPSAKLYFALLTFWSKSRLCMLILDGELFWYCHL